MKKITYFIVFLILCNIKTYSQSQSSSSQPNTDLENIMLYKRVQILKNATDIETKLHELGFDLDCGVTNTEFYIELELSEIEIEKLKSEGLSYTITINDLTKYYSERAIRNLPQAKLNLSNLKTKKSNQKNSSLKTTTFGNITHRFENEEIDWAVPNNFQLGASFGGCLTVDESNAQLDLMRSLYPNLITVKQNVSPSDQKTIGGRSIYVVKISNSAIAGPKPETLYTGMTHSREVVSLMNLNYFMWYLLENYATDPDVKNLVDHHDLYFIPIVNPDGLAYNQQIAPTGGGMQRKNRRETGACTTYLDGIDLNRNWGTYWGYDNTGSSSNGCDDTYRGTAGFSEAETTSIKDFFLLHNFKTSINHHSYKNAALHGRAAFYRTNNSESNAAVPTGRENEYNQYSHDMTQYNRYAYGSSPNISYWNNGNSNDWMAEGSGKNTICWTPENGSLSEGGFWPTPSNITGISQRAMRMNFIVGFYSGVYAKLHDLTKSDISSSTGALTFGLERVGQTDGGFTLTVTPISSNILSVTNVAAQTGMTILEQRNLNVNFTLSPGITAKEKIEFEVTLSNGSYIIYKTRIEKYYNPTALFTSTANPTTLPLAGWTAAGATSWAVTSTGGANGTAGITTTASGSYASGITNANLTQTTPITLVGKQQVVIQFDAKWDLERSFDYVELQGSLNGTTWVPMKGKYTKPGSSSATNDYSTTLTSTSKATADKSFQPTSEPLYDGNKFNKWVLEEFFINSTENTAFFNQANVRFRFIFRTDSNNRTHGYNTTFTGFTFDNFKVLEIKSSPPVAICKATTLSLDSSGNLTVLPSDVDNGSSDDIGITAISVSPNTFNCTHKNTNQTVTLSVTDADGQVSTCTSVVTIKDTTAAVPNVTSLTTVTGQCSATLTAPTATDTCYGTITATTPTTFPITAQGTTVVTWTYTDGSGNTSTQTQNVTLNNTMSAIISGSAAICSGSSTNIQVAITGGTSPYTVVYSNGVSNFTVTNYISGTAIVVAPTMATTYTLLSVTSAIGCLSPSNSGSAVISFPTTTWNGSWSNGAPTSTTTAIIASNYSASTNLTACTLTVNNNAIVSIPSGYNVTLNGALTVSSGSFTLNNNANLVQSSNVSNVGNIIIKRETAALMRQDYAMWSSPVTNASQYLKTFSPSTLDTRFYTYSPSTNSYTSVVPTTTNFATGKGYLIRMPNDHPTTPTIWTGTFTGIPYNGNLNLTVTNGTYNAIGNPYPSSINANTFIATNGITEALYFWRKTNNNTYSSYATYTTAGGTANVGGGSSIVPNGTIQVGQGFIARATSTNLQFTNAMRVGNNLNQFLKTKEIELNRIWLNLANDTEPVNQMMLAYMTGATQDVDPTIDGRYINDSQTALNSLLNDEEFVIQGRSVPFDPSDVVPLTFKTTSTGNYTISIDHVDGLFSTDQEIILKDNVSGTETDLKVSPYTFTANAGVDNTRFSLKYQKTLGTANTILDENNIVISKNNGIIKIKSGTKVLDNVKVFDINGKLLVEKAKINATETSIESAKYAKQILIVQIKSEGIIINKKIVN